MTPEVLDLSKFTLGTVGAMGSVWGAAKILAGVKEKAPSIPPPAAASLDLEYKFGQGEKRMDAIDRKLDAHDEKFAGVQIQYFGLRLELGELKPLFQAMKDSITALKGEVNDIEGNLSTILERLPDQP